MWLTEHHNWQQELLKLKANNGHKLQTTKCEENNNNEKTLASDHPQPPTKLWFSAFSS